MKYKSFFKPLDERLKEKHKPDPVYFVISYEDYDPFELDEKFITHKNFSIDAVLRRYGKIAIPFN